MCSIKERQCVQDLFLSFLNDPHHIMLEFCACLQLCSIRCPCETKIVTAIWADIHGAEMLQLVALQTACIHFP